MSKVACVVISLLLGIIIGLGAVVGGVFLVLSINVDTLLGWVGLEDDNKNDDGTYVYIAGDQSLLKTINDTIDFFSSLDTSTLAGLNDFLPAVGLAVNNVADYLLENTGVDLDVDGLMECPINDMGSWLSDWVREIQLYPVVETLLPSYIEGDDVMAVIVKALVLGVEADYYTDENGDRYPVYYYTVEPGSPSPYGVKFLADGDDDGNDDEEDAGDNYVYYYYYVDSNGIAWYLEKLEDGTYRLVDKTYDEYSEDTATCTGDYYREETEDGYEYVIVDPVVLGDFYDSENLSESIYAISLDDLLGEGDIADILGGYTIGDLVDGGIDFNEFEVADFIDLNPETDDLFISIIYGISQLEKNEDGTWSGIYTDDDGTHDVIIEVDESGYIERAYYTMEGEDGNEKVVEVAGVTLGGISESLSTLELVTVMGYPDVTDALMMYILYGVTDVYKEQGDDGEYVYCATYTKGGVEYTAEITVTSEDDGTIRATSSLYTDSENSDVKISTATTLDNISDVTDNILDALSIADFVGDVDVSDALFMYLSYGVYDIYQDENGDWYGYKKITTTTDEGEGTTKVPSEVLVRIIIKEKEDDDEDGKDYVDHITYTTEEGDEVRVKGTKIDELDEVIDGIMGDLTLGVFIGDVTTDDTLMAYLLYSVTGIDSREVTAEGDTYTEWFATFHTGMTDENEEEITFEVILDTYTEIEGDGAVTVYITGILGVSDKVAESDAYINYVYEYGRVRGATIDDINEQIDGLMNNVPIKDIVSLGDGDNIILNAIGSATINTLGDAINAITVQSLFPEDIYNNTATLFVDYGDSYNPVYAYDEAMGYSKDEAEAYYAGYEFCYRLGSETEGYTYYQLTYTESEADIPITDRATLAAAVCAYNGSAGEDSKITCVYIFTTTYRQVIIPCDICECAGGECCADCGCGDECECEGVCTCTDYGCACDCEGGEYCGGIGVCTCCYIYDEYFLKYADGTYVKDDEGKYVVNEYIVFSGDYIYYDADGNLAGNDGKLTLKELKALNGDVYTYGEVTGVWKFMLCDMSEGSYDEQICGINDVANLMTTTEKNLMSATLMDFYEIGILDIERATLLTPIPSGYDIDAATVGDLSLKQAIDLMVAMISALPTGNDEP